MRLLPVIGVLIFLSAAAAVGGGDPAFPDDSVREVARSSLSSFLDKIPVGLESRYGFQKRDEFGRAAPGTPLRVYTESRDSLNGGAGEFPDYPTALDEWRVPVLVDGELRSLLTVARTRDGLEAVDLGAAALAREFGEFDKKHPGGRRALLRIYRLKCDFIMMDRTGTGMSEGEYHPLRSARLVFKADSPSPRSRKELFDEIHRLYRQRPADR
jgi:hypothetical protein